ncbi:MAG: cytochrome b [Herbaspirillum sp.]
MTSRLKPTLSSNDFTRLPARYTHTAIALHWLMAVMIICSFALGVTMVNIPGLTPTKLKYFSWHKWLGVTILTLACVRLLWRLSHRAPAPLSSSPRWQQNAAHAVHTLLYVLIFAVPLSGYCFSLASGVPVVYLGLLPLPVLFGPDPVLKPILQLLHYSLNLTLLLAVGLHIGATLQHHFIHRDDTLKRMLP